MTASWPAACAHRHWLGGRSARENAAIAGFAKTMGALSDAAEIAHAVCAGVSRLLDVDTVLLVRDGKDDRLVAASPSRTGWARSSWRRWTGGSTVANRPGAGRPR